MADPHKADDGPEKRVGSLVKGKWTIEALLGVGGMASVYAASHRNGQRAALKILHLDFARDKTICERFLREGYVSNKIGHSACVAVLDDDRTEDEAPFLVMELLEGETVRDAWKRAGRRMQVPQVLKISDDVLDCLVACHAIGVIHRDLKPANIFITNQGVTKVLDFGVAQMRSATSERTATGTALGTPAYMSPEQAMGLVDQLDGRADIFSVGAMIHALTTGHRINNGRTENEALVMAATTPVPSVARIAPDLPVELIALIDKSLAWDRRNRYSDAREMQAAIREIAAVLSGGAPAAAPAAAPAMPEIEIPPVEGEQMGRRHPSMGSTSRAPALGPVAPSQGSHPSHASRPSRAAVVPVPAPAAPAPISAEPAAAADDPRVEALRDLFKRIERLLPSVRQFGWEHPATARTMQQTYDGFVEAIQKDPKVVDFTIRPYSMMMRGQTVWEPGPPFDSIPYNMFACGMRTMRMEVGISFDELKDTMALMLVDPGRDLPPEDDLAAAFWERGMAHVHYECVDAFADGDAAARESFYNESDELERLAAQSAAQTARIEAKAMAVSTDRGALKAAKVPSPMGVEEVVRAVFAQQLEIPRGQWSERYVDAVIDGYIDAAVNRDAPLVLASLRKSGADLVVAGRLNIVVSLHNALIGRLGQKLQGQNLQRLAAALTNAIFGAETLELVLKYLHANPDVVPVFEPILAVLSQHELHRVLTAIRLGPPQVVRDALLNYVASVMAGSEAEVAAAAAGLEADNVSALLAVLARAGTAEARQALSLMAQSDDINVRVESRALLAGEASHGELTAMVDNQAPLVRLAALRAVIRHQVKGAWAAVARHVKAPDFNEKGADERRELLRALVSLIPDRGEPIALELAKKGGVFVSEAREGSRVAAAEALGEMSRSPAVAAALREIALARWGTSDETRAAALAAAELIGQRIAAGDVGGSPYGGAPAGVSS